MTIFKRAVCVMIMRDGKHLAISRRNDSSRWGLVGGKVDPGETDLQAIVRETQEEIGFHLDPQHLVPVFEEICEGAVSYTTVTFLYTAEGPELKCLTAEEGMVLQYTTEEFLCDEQHSPFAKYNRSLFENLV